MELADVINEAEREEIMWALLVEHADGQVEALGWDGSAGLVFDLEGTKRVMGEWLLAPEPVPCDKAAATRASDFLVDCERCASVG